MKLTATVHLTVKAGSLEEAGAALDALLAHAADQDSLTVDSIELGSSAATPVTLPQLQRTG